MTKSLLAGLSCLLVLSVLPMGAEAAPETARKKRPASRTVEIRYDRGAIPFGGCLNSDTTRFCPEVWAEPGERFVTVEVIDDVSPRANVDVAWTTNDRDEIGYFNVCGSKTETLQPIPPSADLGFYPWVIPSEDCTTGFSTSGTIKITFSRRP